jgi:hypothetical protein
MKQDDFSGVLEHQQQRRLHQNLLTVAAAFLSPDAGTLT